MFILLLPYTVNNYLADELKATKITTDHDAFVNAEKMVASQLERFISCEGNRSVDSFHKELGNLLYDYCGLSRTKEGLAKAMEQIMELKDEFYTNVRVLGAKETINAELEKAGRVADYFDIAVLMCQDAYERDESSGVHFKEEHQSQDGEALRDDENFQFSSIWKFEGENNKASLIKERLIFEYEQPTTRSYK